MIADVGELYLYTDESRYEVERLEWEPEPPKRLLRRWLSWTGRKTRNHHLRIAARKTNEALKTAPKWPREAGREARRAVIHPKLLDEIDQWDGLSSLVFLGPTGCGKTTATYEATEALIVKHAEECRFWLCPHFTKTLDITQAWRSQKLGASEPACVTQAQEASLLVLDDLGQEASDPQRALWSVFDVRYDEGRPTIVTSGLRYDGADGLLGRYGDAFVRRILEAGKPGKIVDLW